jgi:hypothetical protein
MIDALVMMLNYEMACSGSVHHSQRPFNAPQSSRGRAAQKKALTEQAFASPVVLLVFDWEYTLVSRVVLVVDDDPLVLDVTACMLEDLGCEVVTAHGGSDALSKLSADDALKF